jgi:hypothetical protein
MQSRVIARVVGALGLLGAMILASGTVAARQAQIDPAFSDTIIRTLGYPEVTVEVGPEGVTAPATLPAGLTSVTLRAAEGLIGYVDLMQPPAGLSADEATTLALNAARDDLAQADWVYLGGTNTPNPGQTATFLIDLAPGMYQWAASSYHADGSNEIMHLAPLNVTPGAATPRVGTPTALSTPKPGVTLEMTDRLRYMVSPNPVPAGPQIWQFSNTGMHSPHHVVMMRVPNATTSEQIVAEMHAMMAGTPPASDSLTAQSAWVGYAALQSGGTTTWAEFDLEPATYAVICYIVDPVTGRPHVLDGMVDVFTVV